jgi:hypothetical protein
MTTQTTPTNVIILRDRHYVSNGIDPKMRRLPRNNLVAPPSGLPPPGKLKKKTKGENLAGEFFDTFQRKARDEQYRKSVHDFLNVRDTGAPPVYQVRHATNLKQAENTIRSTPNEPPVVQMDLSPPEPPTPPTAPSNRTPVRIDQAAIDPITKQMIGSSSAAVQAKVAQATASTQTPPATRDTGVDAMTPPSSPPPLPPADSMEVDANLNQIVQHVTYQTNHYTQQLFQNFLDQQQHHQYHLNNYNQVVNNHQSIQNVLNNNLHQQIAHITTNQQLNNLVHNNNLAINLADNRSLMIEQPRGAIQAGINAAVEAPPTRPALGGREARLAIEDRASQPALGGREARLAIEDRYEPNIEVLPPELSTAVVPREMTVERYEPPPRRGRPREPRPSPVVRRSPRIAAAAQEESQALVVAPRQRAARRR